MTLLIIQDGRYVWISDMWCRGISVAGQLDGSRGSLLTLLHSFVLGRGNFPFSFVWHSIKTVCPCVWYSAYTCLCVELLGTLIWPEPIAPPAGMSKMPQYSLICQPGISTYPGDTEEICGSSKATMQHVTEHSSMLGTAEVSCGRNLLERDGSHWMLTTSDMKKDYRMWQAWLI